MTEIPEVFWSPNVGLLVTVQGGRARFLELTEHDPVAIPDDAVRLVPAPAAPRVFLPGDEVPVGTVITGKDGSPFSVPDMHASEGLARVGAPFVEVRVPSPAEWQSIVDQAAAARANSEWQHTEGTNP